MADSGTRRLSPRLPKPSTLGANVGYRLAAATRITVGLATALPGWLLGLTPFTHTLRPGAVHRALWQLAALEAILCVPGLAEAACILVKRTLAGSSASERYSAALQDAASANKRLATWLEILQPSLLGRLCLLLIHGLALQTYAVGFLLLPSMSRSVAAYLEFASSKAYAVALQDMDDEQGLLSPLGSQRIPWETCVLCNLQVGSTVKDALPLFCTEAEEHSAAYLTAAHAEASWWEAPLQRQIFTPPKSPPAASPLKDKDAAARELSSPRQLAESAISALRPSSYGSIKRMSQLFDSKWARTPRDTPTATPLGTLQPDDDSAAAQLVGAASQLGPEPVQSNGVSDGSQLHGVMLDGREAEESLAAPMSPGSQSLAPDTPPADDGQLLITELSANGAADEGEVVTIEPSTGEVFVDAKEALTPAPKEHHPEASPAAETSHPMFDMVVA